jgi:hypothetical protein
MSFQFNPFTGTLDIVGDTNFDLILTGPTDCLYSSSQVPLSVLIDNNGNVLTG